MTILHFPAQGTSAFDPESLSILAAAFDDAWEALQTAGTTFHFDGHACKTREILARCIIEMAKLGELDRHKLPDAALAHLAEANIRTAHN